MPKRIDIGPINKRLEEAGQVLRVLDAGPTLRLSNGKELRIDDRRNFLRRVDITKHNYWIERIDRIYNSSPQEAAAAVAEVKSILAAIGGKNVWKKHRESLIRQRTNRVPHNKGKKMSEEAKEHLRQIAADPEVKRKASERRQGNNNPMYGRTHSDEYKEQQSKRMKQLILEGKFTPNSNNRNTHWDSSYRGKSYRSSWEALYQALDPAAEYEQLRIPYRFQGKEYIYIVDFVNHISRKVVEVKPNELTGDDKTRAKLQAARQWAEEHGYQFLLADQTWLFQQGQPILNDFDSRTQERISKFYEANLQKNN